MKRSRKLALILLIPLGTGAACLTLPGPISGDWTGGPLGCLCEAHHFIRIKDEHVIYYSGHETNYAPVVNALVKTAPTSYEWQFLEWIPPHDGKLSSIRTNGYSLKPHLLHMVCRDPKGSPCGWMYRDFAFREKKSLVNSVREPVSIETERMVLDKVWQRAMAERVKSATKSDNSQTD